MRLRRLQPRRSQKRQRTSWQARWRRRRTQASLPVLGCLRSNSPEAGFTLARASCRDCQFSKQPLVKGCRIAWHQVPFLAGPGVPLHPQCCRTDPGPETARSDTAVAAVQGSGRPSRWRPSMRPGRRSSPRRRTCASWTSREHRQARLASCLQPVSSNYHHSTDGTSVAAHQIQDGSCVLLACAALFLSPHNVRKIATEIDNNVAGLRMSLGATCLCCRHTGQIQSSQAVCACGSAGGRPPRRRCFPG